MFRKTSRKHFVFSVCALLTAATAANNCVADTIELQSGEVIQGKIIRETTEKVIIETKFSERITEERQVPRAEIKSITRVRPDEAAFNELRNVEVPMDAFTPEVFDPVLNAYREFVQKFPYSSKVQAVRDQIRKVERERELVAIGGVKLNGQLLKPEELGEQAAEIEKHRSVVRIQQLADRGDYAGAINAFDAFAKEHANSPAYVKAVEQAREHVAALRRVLQHEQRNNPILEERRRQQLAIASESDRRSIEAARQRELDSLKAAIERAKKDGAVIPPYASFSMESLQGADKAAADYLQKLSAIDLSAKKRAIELMASAENLLQQRELVGARQRVEQSLQAWPENSAALHLQAKINAEIERRAQSDAAQARAVEEGFTSSSLESNAEPAGETGGNE